MNTLGKHWTLLVVTAKQRLGERATLVARVGFYGLILFVFSRIWSAVLAHDPDSGLDDAGFVWYLAITEWIVLSIPNVFLEIEEEHKRGDLVHRLAWPLPYPTAKLAEALGQLVVRLSVNGVAGFTFAWLLTGRLPVPAVELMAALPLALGASVLATTQLLLIGLSAFWLHDTRPVYWIWQKGAFILGGLMVPLSLYPAGLRAVAEHSPFAPMLNGPGRVALGADGAQMLWTLGGQLAWLAVSLLLLGVVYRRALRRVEFGGG